MNVIKQPIHLALKELPRQDSTWIKGSLVQVTSLGTGRKIFGFYHYEASSVHLLQKVRTFLPSTKGKTGKTDFHASNVPFLCKYFIIKSGCLLASNLLFLSNSVVERHDQTDLRFETESEPFPI